MCGGRCWFCGAPPQISLCGKDWSEWEREKERQRDRETEQFKNNILAILFVFSPVQVLVFDFGSEVYVWHGKDVSLGDRKMAVKLAKQLYSGSYDYSSCRVNPLDASSDNTCAPQWVSRRTSSFHYTVRTLEMCQINVLLCVSFIWLVHSSCDQSVIKMPVKHTNTDYLNYRVHSARDKIGGTHRFLEL